MGTRSSIKQAMNPPAVDERPRMFGNNDEWL
jgi:hypothetical protein